MKKGLKGEYDATITLRIPRDLKAGIGRIARNERTKAANIWRRIGFEAIKAAASK